MRFGKRHSKMTVMMAMVNGVVIGVVAIIVVGIIFVFSDGKRSTAQIEKDIPTSGPVSKEEDQKKDDEGLTHLQPMQFFAKQHGAFSNLAAAETFIAEDSSLTTAAIFLVDAQHYVWSMMSQNEILVTERLKGDTFKKAFTIHPAQCASISIDQLWEVFGTNDLSKINFLKDAEKDEKTLAFEKKIQAITAYTNDLSLIHLQLLAAYTSNESCVKISF